MSQLSIRKVALLLSALPSEDASRLLERLPRAATDQVQEQLQLLATPDLAEQKEVIGQFLLESRQEPASPIDSIRLHDGERNVPPLHFLSYVATAGILELLSDELPQTKALVVSMAPGQVGAEMLARLPPAARMEVVRKMVTLDIPPPEVKQELAKTLRHLTRDRQRPVPTAEGVSQLMRIVDESDVACHQVLISTLERADPQLWQRLSDRLDAT